MVFTVGGSVVETCKTPLRPELGDQEPVAKVELGQRAQMPPPIPLAGFEVSPQTTGATSSGKPLMSGETRSTASSPGFAHTPTAH